MGGAVNQPDPARNVDLVRRYVNAVNTGDLDAIDGLFAADYVNHRPTGPDRGPRAMREFVLGVRRMLAGLAVTIDEIIADGDKVGVRLTLRGTLASTGKAVAVPEIQMYRIAGGQIVERWFVVNRIDLQPTAPVSQTGT
jgi:ketosteroid isomerase-like protein